jgi:hypothetical protein
MLASNNKNEVPTLKKLWCSIRRTTTKRVKLVANGEFVAESEICDLDVHVGVQEEILSLSRTIHNNLSHNSAPKRQTLLEFSGQQQGYKPLTTKINSTIRGPIGGTISALH